MFEHIDKLAPICKEIGFENVTVDDSNSLMQYELPDEEEEEKKEEEKKDDQRFRVHVGSAEFKHLADYDMNSICARVTVFGQKPE